MDLLVDRDAYNRALSRKEKEVSDFLNSIDRRDRYNIEHNESIDSQKKHLKEMEKELESLEKGTKEYESKLRDIQDYKEKLFYGKEKEEFDKKRRVDKEIMEAYKPLKKAEESLRKKYKNILSDMENKLYEIYELQKEIDKLNSKDIEEIPEINDDIEDEDDYEEDDYEKGDNKKGTWVEKEIERLSEEKNKLDKQLLENKEKIDVLKKEADDLYGKRKECSDSLSKSRKLLYDFEDKHRIEYLKIRNNERLEEDKERLEDYKKSLEYTEKYSKNYLYLMDEIEILEKSISNWKEETVDENIYKEYLPIKKLFDESKNNYEEIDSSIRKAYREIEELSWAIRGSESRSKEIQKKIDDLEKRKGN